MRKGKYLARILRSEKTVFSVPEIAMLWREDNMKAARVRLSYFVKKGELYRIRQGLYAKDEKYDRLELATKIFRPAYVSFETVLAREGIIFQYQQIITIASYVTKEVKVGGESFAFRKIKDRVLMNAMGVEVDGRLSVAGKERALLDTLYVYRDFQFDNLRAINWELIFEMVPIYDNKRLIKTVNDLYKKQNDT